MTVQVGNVTISPRLLPIYRQAAAAAAAGVPAAMFGNDARLFRFADVEALFRGMHTLRQNGWPDAREHIIPQFILPRPGQQDQPGTVQVGNQTYANLDALALAADFVAIAEHADTINSALFVELANDTIAVRWQFDNWVAYAAAIDGAVAGQAYPDLLRARRVARTPTSVAAAYDPTQRLAQHVIDAAFGNCGRAATHIIGRIHDLGGTVQLIDQAQNLVGEAGAARFDAMLNAHRDVTVLINVANDVIHEFTIERRPNDTAVLQQGYQGSYDALWWADAPRGRPALMGADIDKMPILRNEYGGSRTIPLATLRRNLGAFMTAPGLRSECARTAWQLMPFRYGHEFADDGDPAWDIKVWAVTTPQPVIDALVLRGIVDHGYDSWLTTAVLREASQSLVL